MNAVSPTETEEVKTLVFRWRRVLRLGSGNARNGMISLALLRLEGSLLEGGVRSEREGARGDGVVFVVGDFFSAEPNRRVFAVLSDKDCF